METQPPLCLRAETPAHVTPLEVLEDFAACAATWTHEDEDSHFLSSERGRPSVVLHHASEQASLVFVAESASPDAPVRLTFVDVAPGKTESAGRQAVEAFVSAFDAYLRTRSRLVVLDGADALHVGA